MISELILIGTLTVTSYRPTPAQTRPECVDRYHCDTANGDGITMYGVAVSGDYLDSGELKYGDVLFVPGFGMRVVNDRMGDRAKHSIDLLVFTKAQERKVGTRHEKVYLVRVLEKQGAK